MGEKTTLNPDDQLSNYDFALPLELIAQEPAAERGASRLFVLPREGGEGEHLQFAAIDRFLEPGDLLVVNDTKVLPARIEMRRATGGRVRGLLLEIPRESGFLVMLDGKGRLRPKDQLATPQGKAIELVSTEGGGVWQARGDAAACEELLASGRMPLPPYIDREATADARDALDRERYQTVFAREAGAVAAPTAGLHFDSAHLARLVAAGIQLARVTLHVGLGTFLPVRVDDLGRHVMHRERFSIGREAVDAIRATRTRGGRVIAVGTTAVRTLETWSKSGEPDELQGETDLFIRPGFQFRVVDGLLTNFHLPKSTLLVLVAAIVGRERVLRAYAEAVSRRYRFFSYGDAMLIPPAKGPAGRDAR